MALHPRTFLLKICLFCNVLTQLMLDKGHKLRPSLQRSMWTGGDTPPSSQSIWIFDHSGYPAKHFLPPAHHIHFLKSPSCVHTRQCYLKKQGNWGDCFESLSIQDILFIKTFWINNSFMGKISWCSSNSGFKAAQHIWKTYNLMTFGIKFTKILTDNNINGSFFPVNLLQHHASQTITCN